MENTHGNHGILFPASTPPFWKSSRRFKALETRLGRDLMPSPTSYPIIIASVRVRFVNTASGTRWCRVPCNLRTETLIPSVKMAEEGELSSPDELETSKSYIVIRLWSKNVDHSLHVSFISTWEPDMLKLKLKLTFKQVLTLWNNFLCCCFEVFSLPTLLQRNKEREVRNDRYLRNRKHVPCFYRVIIQTRVEVWENEKCCGTRAACECFHSFFEFSQTFTSVCITRQKHEVHVCRIMSTHTPCWLVLMRYHVT